ncbi:hypothetical protein [Bradyrhizobium sp.]|uniref:hypothetical protein n=1 Tax=Bradyrhizobium sp. TaxID=376 RepID=UPI003C3C292D
MHRLLSAMAALLMGINAGRAQVSTIGTTAMGLPSTPGAIVSSPLNGPSPFSAATQPGAPDTTLAPVPLALDPTISGTVVTCGPPSSGQITPPTPTVTLTSVSAPSGTTPSLPVAPGTIAAPTRASMPAAAPSIAVPTGGMSTSISGSATGTIPPTSPLGGSSSTRCGSAPGGPPTNGASLPLTTPEIAANPPPGTIQPATTELGGTSIDPTMTIVPTPNASACAVGVTMNLATPAMMMPANATGAAATPGVSAPPSPSGC